MFIFVLIALLRAQLTTDKRAGCQKGERWQPGKASRRARCFLPSRDTLPLGERGTRFASPGGQEGGSHSSPPFPPPRKEQAHRPHRLPGKGHHSFCSAAHPCCRSSDAHAGRSLGCCRWSLLPLLQLPELWAKVFKVERARQSHPLPPSSPVPSPGHCAKGAFSLHPTTHPPLAHGQAPPRRPAPASPTPARSCFPAYCFYLCPTWTSGMLWINSLPPPDRHQPPFPFLHVNAPSVVQPTPPSLPTAACVSSLRWVSHRGSLPRDQRSDVL